MTVVGLALYSLAISLLLSLAAWLLDRGLSRVAIPTRWVWFGALALSLGLPAVEILGAFQEASYERSVGAAPPGTPSATAVRPTGVVGAGRAFDGVVNAFYRWNSGVDRALVSGTSALSDRLTVQRWATTLWGGMSLLLALLFTVSIVRLARQTRRWPRETWLGRPVRVAPDLGPATLGLLRPEIVVPRWAAELGPDELEMVLRHEEEHANSRDPLLQTLGLLPLVAYPWNPLIWWQVRGLRDAVEVDCDRRVLGRGVMAPRYAELLVRLGSRAGRAVVPVASMAGSRSLLERRLTAMTRTTRRMAIPAAFASAVAAVPLVIVACNAEPPSAAADLEEIRVEMFFAATKIELFRADVGNLPETLVVGIPGDSFRQGGPIVTIAGIDFTRRGESAYSLTSSVASEILSYDSSSDNPYSWLGLDDASGTGPSWDGTSDTRERHARLLASGFAEGLYRNRADLLGWSDEAPGRPSPTAILRVILTAVESSDLSMTLEEIAAANGELSDLRLRYSEDYPRIQELQRQVDTGRLTPDLDRIVNELKARAAEVSG